MIEQQQTYGKDELVSREADTVARDWKSSRYYADAESDTWVATFWGGESLFHKLFCKLDRSIIVDLACGHGRHSWQMRDLSNKKILVDVGMDNIEFCIERFAGIDNYEFINNNGIDLREISSSSCTSLFTFDAAVHFSHIVVYNYLIDTFRILKNEGMALYHHSNFSGNPGGDYRTNPSWRNFMPPGLFIDYAKRVGFEVVEHHTFDWGQDEDIDGLTLVRKP